MNLIKLIKEEYYGLLKTPEIKNKTISYNEDDGIQNI
jgi:hypothetical protein